MSERMDEIDGIERDLWWGHLCPALANIGALKDAQRDLIALGADWAEAGRILSRVQSFYVDAAHQAAQRYLAAVEARPKVNTRRTDWGVRDDATGNVGTVLAYNRATTETWLAELTEPSTLMRRERTTYEDDVTEWVPVEPSNPPPPTQPPPPEEAIVAGPDERGVL